MSKNKDLIYWTMRDGRKILVDDMDINHLRNVLKMIIMAAEIERAKKKQPMTSDPSGILANFQEDAINEIEEDWGLDEEVERWGL